LTSCAAAPPPPSQSAHDPSNPGAEETPVLTASASASTTQATAMPAADAPDAGVVYACPMHPEVTATEPGHRCPKCGMTLVPRQSKP
jgi:hypothetical protein